MSKLSLGFHEVQNALCTVLESYTPTVESAFTAANWPTNDGIPVYKGPLGVIPKVPSVIVSVPSISWEWGAVRCLEGTFNCNILFSVENLGPEKRNEYLGIFEGEMRGQINDINHLQFTIEDDDVERASIYDSLLTAGTIGEMSQGSYYSSRCTWFGKIWVVQVKEN